MSTLNLGILAHVDAGKTSLTERLLFAAGVIDEIGRVDDGSTQTDSLALERRRGITIKSAVVSFTVDDVTVNLIDTPGHPDFIAEVERVLSVLDGAVLVVSAVEGVQAQTRVLMRTLRRLGIPTLVFVNKTDRGGARSDAVFREITEKLTPSAVALGAAHGLGTPAAAFVPYGEADAAFTARVADVVADHDDDFLAAYVREDGAVPYGRLRGALAAQARRGAVHPVYFGSAVTGAGIDALTEGIRDLLPAAGGDPDGPLSGRVFKVERGAAGEKIAYARVFTGTVRVRDRVPFGRGTDRTDGKVTAVAVFDEGGAAPRDRVTAGRIARLWGLGGVRIGDALGVPPAGSAPADRFFPPPGLESVVVPLRAADKGALHAALGQLAEQDPLIDLRQDDIRQEVLVSLYGEVQKEVVQATLADDFGIEVAFRESTTVCVERPAGTGEAVEFKERDPERNPFLATVGLRIEPAPVDSGVEFGLEIELGSLPLSFLRAIEETVRDTLRQGLYGWQVTDCVVTLTRSGYNPRQSHAHAVFDKSMSSTSGDFRNLTPLVLMDALKRAGSGVYEPMHRFELDVPAEAFGPLLPVLTGLGAVPRAPETRGATCLLSGVVPAARVHELERRLPTLTHGEGVLETAFDHYRPVQGAIPVRSRSDHDPLHRKEYLRRVTRRTG